MNVVRNSAFAAFDFLVLFIFLVFLFWSTGVNNVCDDEYYTDCFSNTSLLAVVYFFGVRRILSFLDEEEAWLDFPSQSDLVCNLLPNILHLSGFGRKTFRIVKVPHSFR